MPFEAPPGLLASHHAWLCRQYMVLAELLLPCGEKGLAQLTVGGWVDCRWWWERLRLLRVGRRGSCAIGLLAHSCHCASTLARSKKMASLASACHPHLVSLQREQQPGVLYLAAAKAAIERRRVAAFISGMHAGKPPPSPGNVSGHAGCRACVQGKGL